MILGIAATNLGRQDQIALEVDDMLGLVGQVRPTVFQLRDFSVGIDGRGPLVVRDLLVLSPLVDSQIQGSGWHLDLQMFHGAIPHNASADRPFTSAAGFTIETGMQCPFEEHVRQHLLFVQTAVNMFEQRYA